MKTTNKKHHHPQALAEDKDREEWHNLCHKLSDLYDKMEGNEEGLTSLIIFKRTPCDYIVLKGNNMRVDFGLRKDSDFMVSKVPSCED